MITFFEIENYTSPDTFAQAIKSGDIPILGIDSASLEFACNFNNTSVRSFEAWEYLIKNGYYIINDIGQTNIKSGKWLLYFDYGKEKLYLIHEQHYEQIIDQLHKG